MMGGFPSSMWRPDGQAPEFTPVSADPTVTGVDLPVGSIVAFGALRYVKWGTVTTNWSLIGPPSNRALQVVTSAGAATMTVSGLTCDSRNYRFVTKMAATVDGSTVTVAFNGNAASGYNAGNWESLLGTSIDFDTQLASIGPIYGQSSGTMLLRAKAGQARHLFHDRNGIIAGRYFRDGGGAYWSTTVGEITSVTLTISAGAFVSGSTIAVFDDGVAT